MPVRHRHANMHGMQSPRLPPRVSSLRRFLLLPEEGLDANGRRQPIRRYQLTSVGPRIAASAVQPAGAPSVRRPGLGGRV
jgi:hypothetical protein